MKQIILSPITVWKHFEMKGTSWKTLHEGIGRAELRNTCCNGSGLPSDTFEGRDKVCGEVLISKRGESMKSDNTDFHTHQRLGYK